MNITNMNFIAFDSTVNGSLISFSENTLLAQRNATNSVFYLVLLNLLNLLTTFKNFLVKTLGFSMCKITSYAKRNNFTTSFPILMLFFFFFLFHA